ncbi:hypothetical protein Stsp02_53050 [Streptomyces sp. NBRC 14336]|jgi:hypothetical protein|uniref:hypothetical protein n=1 Tax=Streptomyces sp. NBRC 14336 TaxID=3030992 RepID=UPI0024A0CD2C|nr:hypothetical protein [Streptomyces sp. NBRC 14336]WBO81264.1 hypothetical protein SBE_005100 [Streptomyces sp. SBE_14.2]GLW49644.1 hypothetical protein Stsp02_53050 [Streptomyces sp. NBRC 14336]
MSGTGTGLTVHPDEAEALAWVMLAELSGTEPGAAGGTEADAVMADVAGDAGEG